MTKEELLKTTDSRQLVKYYKLRIRGCQCCGTSDIEPIYLSRLIKGGEQISYQYTPQEIKEELSLRPHVPNKKERRELRLLKVKKSK